MCAAEVKKFRELDIPGIMTGKKVKIDDILNIPVIVTCAVFRKSKYGTEFYAKIQLHKKDDPENLVIFTASENILLQLKNSNIEYPFLTRIKKYGRSVCFT